ncbi:hypothetical protein T05_8105 [Trichinella murrelli]|uniref:Uncharacterized protein n=1 Tax=Trichinella murrelli TaxID=144512 RepID=A0A0V0SS84_9BILA|nr:hypothetical protein T05_8105 [Trichinella murrelli]
MRNCQDLSCLRLSITIRLLRSYYTTVNDFNNRPAEN